MSLELKIHQSKKEKTSMRERFAVADPFPHIIIDDFLNLEKYDPSIDMNILDALKAIHNPAPSTDIDDILPGGSHPARVRLLKEEMIAFQAGMTFLKRKIQ